MKSFVIRLPDCLHSKIRKAAFDQKVSMAALIRKAVMLMLKVAAGRENKGDKR